jgi:hypothetical protein
MVLTRPMNGLLVATTVRFAVTGLFRARANEAVVAVVCVAVLAALAAAGRPLSGDEP